MPVDDSNRPLVSIIIPSYNSEATIRECLNSIYAMNSRHSFEVIVVDSGTDGTAEIIDEEFPQVRLFHLQRKTPPGMARNLGIRNARGEILAFTDSDCIVEPDWLDRIIESLNENGVNIVYGALRNGTPRNLVGTTSYYLEFNEFLPGARRRFSTIFLGGNLGVRRIVFEKHGLYYNDFRASEDTLLAWSFVQRGERILFDPGIQVTHVNRTELMPMLRHQKMLGWYSGRARKVSNLYGGLLARWPVLCVMIPFVRWMRAVRRILPAGWSDFRRFLLISPLYFVACSFWAAGFARALREPVDNLVRGASAAGASAQAEGASGDA